MRIRQLLGAFEEGVPAYARKEIMKRFILAAALLGGFLALNVTEAKAFVCARGLYRAGCVGAGGGVAVRRGYYGGAVYRGGVYRGGVRRAGVYRRW
jgi:hypothetical protein